MTLTSGNGQTGTVGAPLASAFVVTLADGAGSPLAGILVAFAIAGAPIGASGQALSVTSTTTGTNGQAATILTLGSQPGTYAVAATSAGAVGSPVTFTATAGLPTGVAPVITLGITPPRLAYEAALNGNAPTQSVSITNTGGGTLNWTASADQPWIVLAPTSGTVPATLVVGVNTAGLAPGSYSGTITVAATGASNTPQTAPVTLAVWPFASGLVKVSGDNQTAAINSALSQPLVVRAATGTGTPAAGLQVRFELAGQPAGATGASLSATTATTDSQGQAQTLLTLGGQPGTYQVRVLAAGWMQEVMFTATATATVGSLSAAASVVTANPAVIAADGSSRAVITVIPRDASGRNLGSGQTVTLSRTGSGTLSSVTDKGDGSYTATLAAPATAGSALLSATVNGTARPSRNRIG